MLKIHKIKDVKDPVRANLYDSGIDFFLPKEVGEITIEPGTSIQVGLGVALELPSGCDMVLHNKSSIASKGLILGACVIDNEYRGEVILNLWNISKEPVTLHPEAKIVQGIIRKVHFSSITFVDSLDTNTNRGEGRFGSTGS